MRQSNHSDIAAAKLLSVAICLLDHPVAVLVQHSMCLCYVLTTCLALFECQTCCVAGSCGTLAAVSHHLTACKHVFKNPKLLTYALVLRISCHGFHDNSQCSCFVAFRF